VRLAEAPSYGQPISLYSPESSGAVAYDQLARELVSGDEKDLRLVSKEMAGYGS
jgi:chromosome partitioning protein